MGRGRYIRMVAAIGLMLIMLALAGCPSQPGTKAVTIEMLGYNPKNLTVDVGTTVIWTNRDDTAHTVTADLGGFSSKVMNPGDTYQLIFKNKGVFKYHCDLHPYMKASLTVK
ncbi:MAG: cupredoxin domain-containing protein [Candidatus Aquicultor sp.]